MMSDWQTRLRPKITFTSPSGQVFIGRWCGDQREIEKMIGEHSFPGRDGSIVQDLGSRAARYPLTIYFDGPNHDLIAWGFFEAMKERGPWLVVHPVYGYLVLQPTKATEVANPVESANVTEVQTEWLEPLNEETLETAVQMWGVIDALQKELNGEEGTIFSNGTFENA
jgi:prophage DNA circulation protein